jgi:hypothetical protein
MPIDRELLQTTDSKLCERYSRRYSQFGYNPKTLGWDTQENQSLRFAAAKRFLPNDYFDLCDLGCGFGDFKSSLRNDGIHCDYFGIDINPDLIKEATRRHPDAKFETGNILLDQYNRPLADWVTAFGVLNFKFDQFTNEQFAQEFLSKSFALARKGIIVDMLSNRVAIDYPKEDFVHYYEPEKMLAFALDLTTNVTLVHDYAAIPQKEFMLVLKHSAWS